MRYKKLKDIKKPTIIFLIVITAFRVFLSNLLGIWYDTIWQHDDRLMIDYANIISHFRIPNELSLVKNMSYPLFMDFVHITGISYPIILSFIWIIAAVLVVLLFSEITKNNKFLIFAYVFILYTPIAFDNMAGTRLYRNSIIAPFLMITFTLIIIGLLKTLKMRQIRYKGILIANIFIGIFFTFSYYIKEDGFWLMPILLLSIIVNIIFIAYKYYKNSKRSKKKNEYRISKVILLLLIIISPFLIFYSGTNLYKAINYKYFGIYEINTRTEGELAEFVYKIYKIDSENRDIFIWAPADAIEKAFDASKTLNAHPELKEAIFKSPWLQGDIQKNPINGDFLTWVMRTALVQSDLWESEKQVSDLFKQVNSELDEAFETGKLEEDSKIQLTSSAGGRNISEILSLSGSIIEQFKDHIFMDNYDTILMENDYTNINSSQTATFLTNTYLMPVEGEKNIDYIQYRTDIGVKISSVIVKIYSVLNGVLFVIAIISFISGIILLILKKIDMKKLSGKIYFFSLFIIFVSFGIALLYTLGISWFSQFTQNPLSLKFYSVGLVPILSIIGLFGLYLLMINLKKIKKFLINK